MSVSIIFMLKDREGKLDGLIRETNILEIIKEEIEKDYSSKVKIYVWDSIVKELRESKLNDTNASLCGILENSRNIYFLILEETYEELKNMIDIFLIEVKLILELFPYKLFIEKFFKSKLGINLILESNLRKELKKDIKVIKVKQDKNKVIVKIYSLIHDNYECFEKIKCIYEDVSSRITKREDINYQYIFTLLTLRLIEKYEKDLIDCNKIYIKLFSHIHSLYPMHNLYSRPKEEYNLLKYLKDIESFLKKRIEPCSKKMINLEHNAFSEILDDISKFISNTYTLYKRYLEIIECFKDIVKKIKFEHDILSKKTKFILNIIYKWIILANILTFPPVYLCSSFPFVLFNPIPLLLISFEYNWYSLVREQLDMLGVKAKNIKQGSINFEKIENRAKKIKENISFKTNILTCLQPFHLEEEKFIEDEYDILRKKIFYSRDVVRSKDITDIELYVNAKQRHLLIVAHGPFTMCLIPLRYKNIHKARENILSNTCVLFKILDFLQDNFNDFLKNDFCIISKELDFIRKNIKIDKEVEDNEKREIMKELFENSIESLNFQLKKHISYSFKVISLAKNIFENGNYDLRRLIKFINENLFEIVIIDAFIRNEDIS